MVDWIYRSFEKVDLRMTIIYCDEELQRYVTILLLLDGKKTLNGDNAS
jgi:hypothetical protein